MAKQKKEKFGNKTSKRFRTKSRIKGYSLGDVAKTIKKLSRGNILNEDERNQFIKYLKKMKNVQFLTTLKSIPWSKVDQHEKKQLKEAIQSTLRNIQVMNLQDRQPKKQPHAQEIRYHEINKTAEAFFELSMTELQERITSIDNVYDSFSTKVKKYARFNKKFYEGLAGKTEKEPISLVDDIGFFEWPLTEISWKGDSTGFKPDLQPEGVLGWLGYNVQVDGPNLSNRHKILSRLFEHETPLPQRFPDVYLAEWGNPMSSLRLQKMARSIASFVRLRKGRHVSSPQAIDKWEADLEYLKDKYYSQFQNQFHWPLT